MLGLRVDRYDANQKVLSDKYLLHQAYTVGESTDFLNMLTFHQLLNVVMLYMLMTHLILQQLLDIEIMPNLV